METKEKTKWAIDPAHTEILFKVKHLVITTVSGSFGKYDATVSSSAEDFTDAEISFEADVNSLSTGQTDRDNHLKSPDFFDAANFPKLSFKSTGLKKKSGSDYVLTGDLTIKGISKKIELASEFGGVVKDPWGNTKAGFELSGKLNRKDWGLNWNVVTEAGGLLVGEEVKLQINVELTKQ
jgi:polyisoprenoid-binding protein YceI